ncbi:hypothetical protein [Parapedobacter tibetensis]|uniref:hypothetical protein n=1 Tax=Parapedobacter tibetensis TaxID=2972951 RepID=UPI00214D4EAA|nr:hypothetical protein [Parapedobacter tibetensis]
MNYSFDKLACAKILLSACLLLFSACGASNKGEWQITEISKDTTLKAQTRIKHSNRLILDITGETDDSVRINGVVIPGGIIRDTIILDWYYPSISISYESYRAKKGSLKIGYFLPGSKFF